MCCKNGSKVFYVLFRTFEVSKPVQIFSKQNHVYKPFDVFNQFPSPQEVVFSMKKNLVDDIYSVKIMKVDIPYSKLF
jgi:hypothetical protein